MSPSIFLVGFMGSGKTRVGKLLAKRLGWNWIDLDHVIVEEAGKSIPEIFTHEGEDGFRKREREVLTSFLHTENYVISCGGGIITVPQNLEDLVRQPRSLCLRITPETVFRRVGNDPRRPLLQGKDPYARIQELMALREPFYERFKNFVQVDKLRTAVIVNRIIELFELDAETKS